MILPSELKVDIQGLLYIEKESTSKNVILFSDYLGRDEWDLKSIFYRIPSTNDYIAKNTAFSFTKNDRKEIMEMLLQFNKVRERLQGIDLPIGYIKERKHLEGTIIRYYENAVSLFRMAEDLPLDEIKRVYYRSDDKLENLFAIFFDILKLLETMYDNSVYYYDVNVGNFLLFNYEVKVIDFEHRRVRFKADDSTFAYIIINYLKMVKEILERYSIPYCNLDTLTNNYMDLNGKLGIVGTNFEEVKSFVKKIENNIRRG